MTPSNPSRPARRRLRANRPSAELVMQQKALVPLTVDFYNRLQFADVVVRAQQSGARRRADPDDIVAWARVFPGRDS